ncbi:MAG: sigma-70 family RNA polymerase sigma factor [Actinobacteria bacterium]|nr:sigma-70 family RNA polymerase sigma factor [Actinomycetota bacterium]
MESVIRQGDDRPAEVPLLPLDTSEVVARYESMVYGIAVAHTRCRGDADDVYQDVFLTYHRRQPECRSEEHRKAWLITTALNCARSVTRSSWRTRVVPLNPETAEPTDQFRFATEEQDALFGALRSLPETYRTALYLFYFADLPVARIAELLGVGAAAVKMRLSRGRGLMRDRLQGGYFDE